MNSETEQEMQKAADRAYFFKMKVIGVIASLARKPGAWAGRELDEQTRAQVLAAFHERLVGIGMDPEEARKGTVVMSPDDPNGLIVNHPFINEINRVVVFGVVVGPQEAPPRKRADEGGE